MWVNYFYYFAGVEDVMTDCKTSKVVVKGEKADPLKVLARVQRKSHRQVELISPIPPPPPPEEPKKPEEKEAPKAEEKKVEVNLLLSLSLLLVLVKNAFFVDCKNHHEICVSLQIPVITVVLGVYMHCEACAQGLKKRIQRFKGEISFHFFIKLIN